MTCSNHRPNVVETTKDSTDNRHEVIIVLTDYKEQADCDKTVYCKVLEDLMLCILIEYHIIDMQG